MGRMVLNENIKNFHNEVNITARILQLAYNSQGTTGIPAFSVFFFFESALTNFHHHADSRFDQGSKWVLNLFLPAVFTQAESIAFDPGLFPPGIAASNDPVLQTRVMAYADTQRYRLGVCAP